MGYDVNRASYETRLAAAHKALWGAQQFAEARGDQGAAEDCQMLLRHVTVLQEDSLRGRNRRSGVIAGQMSI